MASVYDKMALACKISRGGFSDERVFEIETVDGKYSGVASRRYCWGQDDQLLPEGEPPLGEEISGKIAVRILQVDESQNLVLVSVPDGETVSVRPQQLVPRPTTVGIHSVSV